MAAISRGQVRRLQTLWGLFCPRAGFDGRDRAQRLGWVGERIGRQVNSFSELTAEEARTAIEAVQQHLPPELLRRKSADRGRARAWGTAGRKGANENPVRMADAETWRLLDM